MSDKLPFEVEQSKSENLRTKLTLKQPKGDGIVVKLNNMIRPNGERKISLELMRKSSQVILVLPLGSITKTREIRKLASLFQEVTDLLVNLANTEDRENDWSSL